MTHKDYHIRVCLTVPSLPKEFAWLQYSASNISATASLVQTGMSRPRHPPSKRSYDSNRKKHKSVTRYGCTLCPDFHYRCRFGSSCSVEKHFRDQHPELDNWQQYIMIWGKRFFNGDGTSHDVCWAELEKDAEGTEEDNDNDYTKEEAKSGQAEAQSHSRAPQEPSAPPENTGHVEARNTTARSTRSALPPRVTAPYARDLIQTFQARPQMRTQARSDRGREEPPPPPLLTINPQFLDEPQILQIGPIDQWILNGQYNGLEPLLQPLARRVLLPPADDMRSREQRQKDENLYIRWFDAVMEFEGKRLDFPRHRWPHPRRHI